MLLKYDGIHVTKEDKDTLKGVKYLSVSIKSMAFALYESQNKQNMNERKIVLLRPDIACMPIQNHDPRNPRLG